MQYDDRFGQPIPQTTILPLRQHPTGTSIRHLSHNSLLNSAYPKGTTALQFHPRCTITTPSSTIYRCSLSSTSSSPFSASTVSNSTDTVVTSTSNSTSDTSTEVITTTPSSTQTYHIPLSNGHEDQSSTITTTEETGTAFQFDASKITNDLVTMTTTTAMDPNQSTPTPPTSLDTCSPNMDMDRNYSHDDITTIQPEPIQVPQTHSTTVAVTITPAAPADITEPNLHFDNANSTSETSTMNYTDDVTMLEPVSGIYLDVKSSEQNPLTSNSGDSNISHTTQKESEGSTLLSFLNGQRPTETVEHTVKSSTTNRPVASNPHRYQSPFRLSTPAHVVTTNHTTSTGTRTGNDRNNRDPKQRKGDLRSKRSIKKGSQRHLNMNNNVSDASNYAEYVTDTPLFLNTNYQYPESMPKETKSSVKQRNREPKKKAKELLSQLECQKVMMQQPQPQIEQQAEQQAEQQTESLKMLGDYLIEQGETMLPLSTWVHVEGISPVSSLEAILNGVQHALDSEAKSGIVNLDSYWDESQPIPYLPNLVSDPIIAENLNEDKSTVASSSDDTQTKKTHQWVRKAKLILSPFARPTGWYLQFENRSIVYALLQHAQDHPIKCTWRTVRIKEYRNSCVNTAGESSANANTHDPISYGNFILNDDISDTTLRVENCPANVKEASMLNFFSRYDLQSSVGKNRHKSIYQWSGVTTDGKLCPPTTYLVHFADTSWARAALREKQGTFMYKMGQVVADYKNPKPLHLVQYPRQIL
jgi:hypothetical protein